MCLAKSTTIAVVCLEFLVSLYEFAEKIDRKALVKPRVNEIQKASDKRNSVRRLIKKLTLNYKN